MNQNRFSIRKITAVAILSALAAVLMMLEISLAFVPSFLKFDFSDLPAFLAAFALGPVSGVLVELVKNVLHLPFTQTSGVGELANFLVGASFVLPAGLCYRISKTKKGALLGCVLGSLFGMLVSFPVNFFVTYPFYTNFMPMDAILSLYTAVLPAADTLEKALVLVNMPFTLVKGLVNTLITFVIYKKISPVLKGRERNGK